MLRNRFLEAMLVRHITNEVGTYPTDAFCCIEDGQPRMLVVWLCPLSRMLVSEERYNTVALEIDADEGHLRWSGAFFNENLEITERAAGYPHTNPTYILTSITQWLDHHRIPDPLDWYRNKEPYPLKNTVPDIRSLPLDDSEVENLRFFEILYQYLSNELA